MQIWCNMNKPQKTGWIYVLETDDIPYFKLGYATDLGKRISDLATGLPFDVEIRMFVGATQDEERQCHRLLRPYRKKGEWYCASPAVIAFVTDLEFAKEDHGSVAQWLTSYQMPAPDPAVEKLLAWPPIYWWEDPVTW